MGQEGQLLELREPKADSDRPKQPRGVEDIVKNPLFGFACDELISTILERLGREDPRYEELPVRWRAYFAGTSKRDEYDSLTASPRLSFGSSFSSSDIEPYSLTPQYNYLSWYSISEKIIPESLSLLKQEVSQFQFVDKPSDADGFGHLWITTQLMKQAILCEYESHSTNNLEKQKFTESDIIALILVGALHDIHEGITGDKVAKDIHFKIEEFKVWYEKIYTTAKKLLFEKLMFIWDGDKIERLLNKTFLILLSEGKLEDLFSKDVSLEGTSLDKLLTSKEIPQPFVRARKYEKFKFLNHFYEKVHTLTFLVAVLSSLENNPNTTASCLALVYDVLRNLNIEEVISLEIGRIMLEGNSELITIAMDLINSSWEEVSKALENEGRKVDDVELATVTEKYRDLKSKFDITRLAKLKPKVA
jgi:hypothetical protein